MSTEDRKRLNSAASARLRVRGDEFSDASRAVAFRLMQAADRTGQLPTGPPESLVSRSAGADCTPYNVPGQRIDACIVATSHSRDESSGALFSRATLGPVGDRAPRPTRAGAAQEGERPLPSTG